MAGLLAAGKTTILFKTEAWRDGHGHRKRFSTWRWSTIITLVFTVFRSLWCQYHQGINCLIYVVDSNDQDRVSPSETSRCCESWLSQRQVASHASPPGSSSSVTTARFLAQRRTTCKTSLKCIRQSSGTSEVVEDGNGMCDALFAGNDAFRANHTPSLGRFKRPGIMDGMGLKNSSASKIRWALAFA